jgi:hypothetical protein
MARSCLVILIAASGVHAADAPLFRRPFNGVPVGPNAPFGRIVPPDRISSADDEQRRLTPGGGPLALPASLPPRFSEELTEPSTTGMTAGGAFFAQFVDHDLDLTREVVDDLLMPPFVFRFLQTDGAFINRRTPGFDLDPVYRFHPMDVPSQEGSLGPWDRSNLRFRFEVTPGGAPDYARGKNKFALMGDARNDQNGAVARIHRAFMSLHNVQVDRIIARDGIHEAALEFLGPQWWDIFNEARNYTTAYYQGIVCNELARQLTGRTIQEAAASREHPVGRLGSPANVLEFAACAFRLHTLVPNHVQIGPEDFVAPSDDRLRRVIAWDYLFGPTAVPAGRLDADIASSLRTITDLFVPGNPIPITLDLVQVNLLRGRETHLPSGEEYLRFLIEELGLDPRTTSTIRGKVVLDGRSAAAVLDPVDDRDLLADLVRGDTDLWAYVMVEAELNDGVLGPVGQDIIERTWITLLEADDWSILGSGRREFTDAQFEFFRTATFDRLLAEIVVPADLTRDDTVDGRDVARLLARWGDRGDREDLTGDGTINAADVASFTQRWDR